MDNVGRRNWGMRLILSWIADGIFVENFIMQNLGKPTGYNIDEIVYGWFDMERAYALS